MVPTKAYQNPRQPEGAVRKLRFDARYDVFIGPIGRYDIYKKLGDTVNIYKTYMMIYPNTTSAASQTCSLPLIIYPTHCLLELLIHHKTPDSLMPRPCTTPTLPCTTLCRSIAAWPTFKPHPSKKETASNPTLAQHARPSPRRSFFGSFFASAVRRRWRHRWLDRYGVQPLQERRSHVAGIAHVLLQRA